MYEFSQKDLVTKIIIDCCAFIISTYGYSNFVQYNIHVHKHLVELLPRAKLSAGNTFNFLFVLNNGRMFSQNNNI